MAETSTVDVTERLFQEFEAVHDLPVITEVVFRCESDLDSVIPAAIPELVERLARQRLIDLSAVE